MSEYVKIQEEYPNILVQDDPARRNKDYSLLHVEPANISPNNYFTSNIKEYKKVYVWNSKLYEEYKKAGVNAVKIPHLPLFDNYYEIESWKSFDEKIDGISLMCRYRGKQACDFDISHKRLEVFEQIEGMTKHTYGKVPYGGEHYKGVIGDTVKETYPSSVSKLKKLDEYKFNLCFENAYHELWSWDYISEKITDCFKAGTVPVYWGCYNIEERIPKEFYVDFREYQNDVDKLSKYLKEMSEEQYVDMTCEATIWHKKNEIGSIAELKEILDND